MRPYSSTSSVAKASALPPATSANDSSWSGDTTQRDAELEFLREVAHRLLVRRAGRHRHLLAGEIAKRPDRRALLAPAAWCRPRRSSARSRPASGARDCWSSSRIRGRLAGAHRLDARFRRHRPPVDRDRAADRLARSRRRSACTDRSNSRSARCARTGRRTAATTPGSRCVTAPLSRTFCSVPVSSSGAVLPVACATAPRVTGDAAPAATAARHASAESASRRASGVAACSAACAVVSSVSATRLGLGLRAAARLPTWRRPPRRSNCRPRWWPSGPCRGTCRRRGSAAVPPRGC